MCNHLPVSDFILKFGFLFLYRSLRMGRALLAPVSEKNKHSVFAAEVRCVLICGEVGSDRKVLPDTRGDSFWSEV